MNNRTYFPLIFLAVGLFFTIPLKSQLDSFQSTRIDSLFLKWDDENSPGCAVGIIKDGKLIHAKGYGSANLDYQVPITAASKFYIASTSKQFTAACIALLALQGKIKLEDDVRKYIPELPDYGQQITVQHLVHHTSGLRDYLGLMDLRGEKFEDYYNFESVLPLICRQKQLNFKPGDQHLYSNTGYLLLAEIVNRESGSSIREFAQQHIFSPLGMDDTFFNDDYSQITINRVVSYRPSEQGSYKRFIQHFDALGSGNLITTIYDLYKWDQNFYHKEVGGEAFINLLLTKGVLNNGDTLEYAFGLSHSAYRGVKNVLHGGSFLGFRTQFVRYPAHQLSIIILANISDFSPNDLAFEITEIFLEDFFRNRIKESPPEIAKPVHLEKEELQAFTGKFQEDNLAAIQIKITLEGDSIYFEQLWDKIKYAVTPVSKSEFVVASEPGVKFTFSGINAGKSQQLQINQYGSIFNLERIHEFDLSGVKFNDYTGAFYSEELDVTYHISLDTVKSVLQVAVENQVPNSLKILNLDSFMQNFTEYSFQRAETSNEVTGFTLNSGRVNGIMFLKK